MAIYGAPIREEKHAEKALRAALEMRERMEPLGRKLIERGIEPIKIGIGINTGDAVIGNIGTLQRMEYTAIGDSVNVASRLEEVAKPDQILISEDTYRLVKDIVDARIVESVAIRGKSEPFGVYEVLRPK